MRPNSAEPLLPDEFTPLAENGQRVRIRVSAADAGRWRAKARQRGLRLIVTDLDTGRRYKVYGASCGLPHCMCDARLREVR